MSGIDHFWAVIPAGGAGTRLWPLSRAASPKFLHDLSGSGRSLLQDTHARLAPLADDRFLVVTGAAHHEAVSAQLPVLGSDAVLAEPSPRDSMAAIGLAAALLERTDPDAVMGSFAADHVIADRAGFEACVQRAVAAAREGWLVTLGIEPTHASSAFGYIRLADGPAGESDDGGTGELAGLAGVQAVEAFVEKPSPATARDYLASGRYRWNAGMFVVRPGVLLDLLGRWHPDFAAALRTLAADLGRLEELWPTLPRIALDHAVAEPAAAAGRVVVVPASFDWDDVGDFDSLATLLARGDQGDQGTTVLGDAALVRAIGASGLVVPGSGRVVAVVGLDDVVVVDTPDALLVTTRARAQEVKRVVDALERDGRADLT